MIGSEVQLLLACTSSDATSIESVLLRGTLDFDRAVSAVYPVEGSESRSTTVIPCAHIQHCTSHSIACLVVVACIASSSTCMHRSRLYRESGATVLTRTLRLSAPNCSHPPITFCRNLSEALVATRNASGLGSLASVCLSSSCWVGLACCIRCGCACAALLCVSVCVAQRVGPPRRSTAHFACTLRTQAKGSWKG
jgi:hypothetical protein